MPLSSSVEEEVFDSTEKCLKPMLSCSGQGFRLKNQKCCNWDVWWAKRTWSSPYWEVRCWNKDRDRATATSLTCKPQNALIMQVISTSMIYKMKLQQAHRIAQRKIKAQAKVKKNKVQKAQFHQVLGSKRVMIKKKALHSHPKRVKRR